MIPEALTLAVSFSPEQVVALLLAVLASGGLGAFGMKKLGQRVEVTDPLRVAQHEFVPRREFDGFRGDVNAGFARLESEMARMADRVEGKHLELLATIERTAKVSVEGRVALWNEVNSQGKQIAALDKTVDVAGLMKRIDEHLAKGGKA